MDVTVQITDVFGMQLSAKPHVQLLLYLVGGGRSLRTGRTFARVRYIKFIV